MRGICCSTTIFGPKGKDVWPLTAALDGLAAAGYAQIEISRKHVDLAAHADAVAARGLTVWAVHGTLGGGCVEAGARTRAFELLGERRSGLLSFDLSDDSAAEDGLLCGGSNFVQPLLAASGQN